MKEPSFPNKILNSNNMFKKMVCPREGAKKGQKGCAAVFGGISHNLLC